MKRVVDCLGIPLDLSQITSVLPINYFRVRNWYFTVVLASGERIKISENQTTSLEQQRNNLIDEWTSYQNKE